MLVISSNQSSVLGDSVARNFEKNAVRHLKEKFPISIKGRSDKELLELVKYGIENASRYNIIEREDVLPFLEYTICYGLEFDSTSSGKWIRKTLKIKNLSGREKMKRLKEVKPLKPDFL